MHMQELLQNKGYQWGHGKNRDKPLWDSVTLEQKWDTTHVLCNFQLTELPLVLQVAASFSYFTSQ